MMSSVLEGIILAAALAASCLAAARPATTSLQPLNEEARDAALTPLPGVKFRHGPPGPRRPARREAGDRFKRTRNCAGLHAHDGSPSGRLSATRRLGSARRALGGTGHENITATGAYGTQYGVNVTFGHQSLLLDLDTGSSDTWAFRTGTNCTLPAGGAAAAAAAAARLCGFGPGYAGGFTHGAVGGEHLLVEYGDGEAVEGPLGYMDVSVGGVRVRNQTVGLADEAVWQGNNVSSGVLGLAYPGLTSAFRGPRGREDPYYAVQYPPVFSTMVDQGLVDSFFSIAINRPGGDPSAGVIGFGGVPEDLVGVDYDTTGQADIIIANVANVISTASDYSFYTIIPDGWFFGSSTDDRKVPYIIDTGTSLIYLPTDNPRDGGGGGGPTALAQAINSMFRPAAEFSFTHGAYLTACDAVAPRVAAVVGGAALHLSPEDLIFRSAPDAATGLCPTALNDGARGPFVLGAVFLRNVLAVFDVGDSVVQLASRVYY